jgi:hypothetical protein
MYNFAVLKTKTMFNSSDLALLLALQLFWPVASRQASAPQEWRWAVQVQGRDRRLVKGTNCRPLDYFTDSSHLKEFDYVHHIPKPYPEGIYDEVETKRRGEIAGFVVYDVVHRVDVSETPSDWNTYSYPPGLVKMIVVQRKPGEFCEIYHAQDSDGEFTAAPSYFVDVGSERVLAAHDPISGNGNYFYEAYWTFDKDGPIPLDLSIIKQTVTKILPANVHVYRGIGFDIETLSYDMGLLQDSDTGPLRQGYVHLTFALKEHQLSVVDTKFDPENSVFTSPTPQKPPHIVIEAAPEQIKKEALAILEAEGYSVDSETASELKISKPYTQRETARFTEPGIACRHVASVVLSPADRGTAVTMSSETVCHRDRSGMRSPDRGARDVEAIQNTLQQLKEKVEGADQRP